MCSAYHPVLRREDGSFSVGACDDASKTIYLYKGLRGSFLKKVLCHELTHAIMFSYNVNLAIEQEEIMAEIFATYGEDIINLTNHLFKKIRRV